VESHSLSRSRAASWLLATALLLLTAGASAAETAPTDYPQRPFLIALTAGVRSFEQKLDLGSEVAVGLRAGAGVNDRVTFLLEYVHTAPARKTTGATAHVSAVRGLAQVRLLRSAVRPYLLAGVGGILFNFEDAVDTAAGTVTFGGGIEFEAWKHVSLFAEGYADIYRARSVTYTSTGEVLTSTERSTDTVGAGMAGIAVEF
jgi:hypothetical protein